eukprot:s3021_g2.t1
MHRKTDPFADHPFFARRISTAIFLAFSEESTLPHQPHFVVFSVPLTRVIVHDLRLRSGTDRSLTPSG